MNTHIRLVKVQKNLRLVVERSGAFCLGGFEQRRRGIEIRDDDIRFTSAVILELVTHICGVFELLLNRTGTSADLFTDSTRRTKCFLVSSLITNGIRTTHLVKRSITRVVARRRPVRHRVRFTLLSNALQNLFRRH